MYDDYAGEKCHVQGIHAAFEQQIDTVKNIFSVLDERANRTPNDSLVEYKNEHGEWSSFSATEFRAKVIAIAKA